MIEAMSKKSVEWLGQSMKINDKDSAQAGDIILHWL